MTYIVRIAKHFNKLFAGIPQVLGFLCFYIILNLDGNYRELVSNRIVSYQIIVSISSLIILGISYTNIITFFKNKHIFYLGIVFIFISLVEVLFLNSLYFSLVFGIYLIGSLNNLLFINLKRPRIEYIIGSSIFSFTFPITLILNKYALLGILVFDFLFLFFYFNIKRETKNLLSTINISNIFFSIVFQAPFFIFNLYDGYLKLHLGFETYSKYLLFMKITNGVLVFFYAQFQINILYNEFESLSKINFKKFNLIILIFIFTLSFLILKNIIVFFIVVALYNVFLNNMSLHVRMNLMKGNYNFNKLWKPFFSFILYSASILFYSYIPFYVIFFLFGSALSILILSIENKNI